MQQPTNTWERIQLTTPTGKRWFRVQRDDQGNITAQVSDDPMPKNIFATPADIIALANDPNPTMSDVPKMLQIVLKKLYNL